MSEESEPETPIEKMDAWEIELCASVDVQGSFYVLDDALRMCRTTVGVMEYSFDGKLASLQKAHFSIGSVRRGLKHKMTALPNSDGNSARLPVVNGNLAFQAL